MHPLLKSIFNLENNNEYHYYPYCVDFFDVIVSRMLNNKAQHVKRQCNCIKNGKQNDLKHIRNLLQINDTFIVNASRAYYIGRGM